MNNDLSDIARGRRISAVTARELDLIAHHARPAPSSQVPAEKPATLREALRMFLSRVTRWIG
ncbi:hypothetical protein OCH239_06820 [Roseivivax halodurans JCM 10272]|uniref:Uncharacterized protein n=1 Tax=Roseivivax halodurans JCM 10272 TaxID=1449350 RepID=X7EEX8_9RHOB|nr:hypothetical protein [Roseivivax halodurans]ETX13776.1 hypothetical protein OCH239_06820 [Roseivivax halodurans JCM 10272]